VLLISVSSATRAQPLAMQKVEGSNPFSRLSRKPRPGGAFALRVRQRPDADHGSFGLLPIPRLRPIR
jgi:hypothetical protein